MSALQQNPVSLRLLRHEAARSRNLLIGPNKVTFSLLTRLSIETALGLVRFKGCCMEARVLWRGTVCGPADPEAPHAFASKAPLPV
jgi:hypothetical protein